MSHESRVAGTLPGLSGTVSGREAPGQTFPGQTSKSRRDGCPGDVLTNSIGESLSTDRATPPREPGELESWRPTPAQRALLADLAIEFGAGPFTSARAAALLDRHVQGVGTFLGRAARSGAVIPAPAGSVRLRRVREVTGGLSLWRFEPAPARDPDEDILL